MRKEIDGLVYKPKRSALAAPPAVALPSTPPGFIQHVRKPMAHSGKDTEDHFEGAKLKDEGKDGQMAFDAVYDQRFVDKDTEDHFGAGMNLGDSADLTTRLGKPKAIGTSEFINDRAATFDTVYSSLHDGKDTEDHFGIGMTMGATEEEKQKERQVQERQRTYDEARERLHLAMPEETHMGHEQADGLHGDTFDHFAGGSMAIAGDDTGMAFDSVYGSQYVEKDTADHFAASTMLLTDDADTGNAFDAAYGSAHEGMDTDSHFASGKFLEVGNIEGVAAERKKRYPNLTKHGMTPPHRPKFLARMAPAAPAAAPSAAPGMALPKKALSAEMQAEMDALVVKGSSVVGKAGGAKPSNAKPSVSFGGSMGGGGGGGGDALRHSLPPSMAGDKFGWDSERIAGELIGKFQLFTRRNEDQVRKLLVAIGNDPTFESVNKNAIRISPKNFNRICDRFGLVCTEQQAREIFTSHKMPVEGCNLYTVAKAFIDGHEAVPGNVRRQPRLKPEVKAERVQHTVTQAVRRGDPFANARLPEMLWQTHQRAQTAPALPPIGPV